MGHNCLFRGRPNYSNSIFVDSFELFSQIDVWFPDKAQLIRPGMAYCMSGTVNSADKLYLVIDSVRPDTKHLRSSKSG